MKVAHQNIKRTIEKAAVETGMKITCVISDVFLTFSGEIAKDLDASWIAVWTALPISLSTHLYTEIIREKCAGEKKIGQDEKVDFVPGLSMLRVKDLPAELLSVGEEESTFSKELSRIGEVLPKATCVTVNCFEELVPEELNNDLRSKFKNYLSSGFLSKMSENSNPNPNSDVTGCLLWLDRQPSKSVAYIAFGTMATLPEKELKALAEALESSKIPFLWSLKDNLNEKLPTGFVERTSKQGKIVAWTPHTAVLGHDSVGVFISHGGYNSVSESIVHGVPMICRPFFGDQMTMARMVEVGWGMGVTVEDGVITRNGLLKKLELFFNDDNENGKKIRENVEQLKKTVLMAALPNGDPARDFSKLMGIITMV